MLTPRPVTLVTGHGDLVPARDAALASGDGDLVLDRDAALACGHGDLVPARDAAVACGHGDLVLDRDAAVACGHGDLVLDRDAALACGHGDLVLDRDAALACGHGDLVLDRDTTVGAPAALDGVLGWLQGALRPPTGLPLTRSHDATITLALDDTLAAEAFRLRVTPERVVITGGGPAGVFWGCQALLQLLPPAVHRKATAAGHRWSVPSLQIYDHPRFAWRGLMLDVARHFMPKHDVLRIIDLMAMHRLNTLHLHLTDDQGWRVEILRYPLLTEVGAWRRESQVGAARGGRADGRPHGGYYTQDDIREIVAYAAQRFITVVPEIETPGHVQAALAAYPSLGVGASPGLGGPPEGGDLVGAGGTLAAGAGPPQVWTRWGVNRNILNVEESTVDFFTGVLDEIMELFPSTYIGVGGDECPKDQWRDDPRTQQRMADLGFTREQQLHAWFVRRLGDHLAASGRRLFGWDEILEGELPSGATIASWRGSTGAVTAARRGIDVVSCPDDKVYLDYRQSELPTEPIPVSIPLELGDVYAFDPVPPELTADEARHVLGGQAALWTEHADSPRTVDYLLFPRLCAVAEALWSPPGGDFTDFERRLTHHLHRLDAFGVEYRHPSGPRPWQQRPGVPGRPATRRQRAEHIARLVATITTP
ncbi:beta-N-acetylhexosaminidase [Actinoplanes subglobosus]|uniref:beta-N-acetylhexosaminidase n=1 Tax=Actinoplanes subglobosus TaxID=1547892 RepID=A0ABV8J507_9ACTN